MADGDRCCDSVCRPMLPPSFQPIAPLERPSSGRARCGGSRRGDGFMFVTGIFTSTYVTDPGLQVSEHLRSAVDKAREARLLPPSSKLNSPTSRHPTLPGGAEDFGLFAELNAGNPGPPQSDDPAFGADFQWNQGWDFSLADQLFSTVTEPHSESAGHGLAFWDRASAL